MFRPAHANPIALAVTPPIQENKSEGSLTTLSFGVKSIISVQSYPRQFGNTIWDEKNRAGSPKHASCVAALLKAGAKLTTILHSSEFAFDITGKNAYGIPTNPKVTGAIPGGSSSGSASAVASNIIDFSMATDTGGSIRIPASYCGVWSLRPTIGVISLEGVLSVGSYYDTVGIIAKNAAILAQVYRVLMPTIKIEPTIEKIFIIEEAFALCSDEIRSIYIDKINELSKHYCIKWISMDEITNENEPSYQGIKGWKDASILLLKSTWDTLSPLLEEYIPDWEKADGPLIPETRSNFICAKNVNAALTENVELKNNIQGRIDRYKKRLSTFLNDNTAILIPTTPSAAPSLAASLSPEEFMNTIALTSIASLAGLPQVQMPLLEDNRHRPLGLSLIGKPNQDVALLEMAAIIEHRLSPRAFVERIPPEYPRAMQNNMFITSRMGYLGVGT